VVNQNNTSLGFNNINGEMDKARKKEETNVTKSNPTE